LLLSTSFQLVYIKTKMPVIEDGVKLDFKDVLVRPKRSSIASRSMVKLERTFTFPNSKQTITCVPIIAANMDTIANFKVAEVLAGRKVLTAVHKHYSVDEWAEWGNGRGKDILQYIAVSCGILDKDIEKTGQILTALPGVKMICLDVANGYSEAFVKAIRKVGHCGRSIPSWLETWSQRKWLKSSFSVELTLSRLALVLAVCVQHGSRQALVTHSCPQ